MGRCIHAIFLLLTLASCDGRQGGIVEVGAIGPEPRLVETVEKPLTPGEALLRSSVAQGLVRFDERGQVVPGLAERWNVSDDGLSYIFRLQTGEWADGRKIRADEIARIVGRQLRAVSKNPMKDSLGAVDEVVAMTERVIEIRLNAARPNLLQLLAQPELGLVRASVGTGPFQLSAEAAADGDKPDGLLLSRRIRIAGAEDPVEQVRLRGGEAEALVAAFAERKIDLVVGGTVGDLPYAMAAKVPRGARRFDPVAGLFGLAPTRRSEFLQDEQVRRLLSRAIDRQALVSGLHVDGLTSRATLLQAGLDGIGQPAQPGWLDQPIDERRAALVAEGNRLFGAEERPTLRLALPDGPGGDYLFGRLRFDWAYLGITVERAPSAASADLIWIDEVAPSGSPAWFLRRFRCDVAAICIEEADDMLFAARTTRDPRQRAALFLEAARLMDEGQLFMAVAAPVRWSLVSGRVPGFAENPFARHTLVGLADTNFSGNAP
ncbi:ABC transporter substrate-binding protein [Sphingomonas xanthus]|uniref:ABC transporter substrate-binding protein n=1 Tax=Sphingomonas xanthus TaxID=2594473 RepID=A0A516ITC5_9SPHN|nr:ABC transporter substrate-binding protein [Sphingomonas xanthus]QDP20084.1 ABC transporter substrate-binding protein [Sphingomonas xanthus]